MALPTNSTTRLSSIGSSFDGSFSSDDRDSNMSGETTSSPRLSSSMSRGCVDGGRGCGVGILPQGGDVILVNDNNDDGPMPEDPDLPRSLIVTNVPRSVYEDLSIKASFEAMFCEFDSQCVFHFLPSFRRVRVTFTSHLAASRAKAHVDKFIVQNCIIHCYFLQVLVPSSQESAHLRLPPRKRQFLISPPSSPPVGWEQPVEDKPVVDQALIDALTKLSPGEQCVLLPRKQINLLGKSVSTPSIVVQLEEEEAAAVAAAAEADASMYCGVTSMHPPLASPTPSASSSAGGCGVTAPPFTASYSLDETEIGLTSMGSSRGPVKSPLVNYVNVDTSAASCNSMADSDAMSD